MKKKPAVKPAKPGGLMVRSKAADEAVQGIMLVDPQALISQAIAKGTSVEGMERLMAMRRELRAEWAKGQYFEALARFQKKCPVIKKKVAVLDKNFKDRYHYASFDDIIEQVREPLDSENFSYRFEVEQDDKKVAASCVMYHRDGHSETSTFSVPIDPKAYMSEPQKYASALTFAKRYAFCNATGIVTGDFDDDGSTGTDIQSRQDACVALIENMVIDKSDWKGTIGQWMQRSTVSLLGPGATLRTNAALDRYEAALKAGRFNIHTAEFIKENSNQ